MTGGCGSTGASLAGNPAAATGGGCSTRIAGVRTATDGSNCCRNPFTDTCDALLLETRESSVESAPCPKINDGAALKSALASGKPGADTMSSTGLTAEEAPPEC